MIKYEGRRVYAPSPTTAYREESEEFDSEQEAAAYAEHTGIGSVITWSVNPNLPGCLPAMRYSSCALDVFEDGAWRAINIF